jgi:hypothetical protein
VLKPKDTKEEVLANKIGIKIKNKESKTCLLIEAAIPLDRAVKKVPGKKFKCQLRA